MKQLITKIASALAVLLLIPGLAMAQETGTIEGVVTEADTELPLPGVNVVITDLQVGSVTNADGAFEITGVPVGEHTLVATFVGYEDFEQTVNVSDGETAVLDITLEPTVAQLEAATVTGYRIEEAAEPTGATVAVSSQVIEEVNAQTATEALQGRAAGVRVTSESGTPGGGFEVQVRGQGSINAGTEPIYIVDGIQINTAENATSTSYSSLAGVDPSDIESIRVLKDAAAASIYGARAANGVVLITTKQGVPGDTQVGFSASVGAVTGLAQSNYEVMSPVQWARYMRDAANNSIGTSWEEFVSDYGLSSLNPEEITGPNWFEAIRRTGITQNYNLSVSGGTESTRFYLSGGYEADKGQFAASDATQGNLTANIDHSITEDLLLGANVKLSTFNKRGDITGGIFINSAIYAPYLIQPHREIYVDPENPEESDYNFWGGPMFNAVALADFTTRDFNANQLISSVNASWTIAPWLTARSQAGVSYQDYFYKNRRDSRIPRYAPGSGATRDFRALTVNLRQLLNYNFFVGDVHSISGLGGVEYRREYEQASSAGAQGFPYFLLRNLQNAATPTSATFFQTEARVLSGFAEVDYTYDTRYTFRVTGRVDGSSRFGVDNRYGLFGSVAAGWRITNEAFMDGVDFVDNLNLRASYGILGNSEIGNFVADRIYGAPSTVLNGGVEYLGAPGLEPTALGNPLLTWEESRPLNLGLDYALFGNRLFGSINVYSRVTNQLLLDRDLPSDSGFFDTIQNVGKIRNQGIELAVSTVNIDAGGFRWSTNFNISFLESEVLELADDDTLLVTFDADAGGGAYYKVGEPLAQYRYIPAAGVNPADGRFMFYDEDGNLSYAYPGVDAEQFYGNNLSDFFGGFGNTFSYKGLSLTAFFQFDYGRVADNTDLSFQDAWVPYNKSTRVLNYWKEPGDVTDTPAPVVCSTCRRGSPPGFNYFQLSSYTLEDASYIRLKQLRLNYDLPALALEALRVSNASVFVQGRNLLTWTEYTGLDPELVGGNQLGEYPQNTSYTAGVNITF